MSLKKSGRVPGFGFQVCMLVWSPRYLIFWQGVTKRCRLSWLTNSALVYESKCGESGWSCGVSANEYSCAAHGAQINFGDLTPYLTYDFWGRFDHGASSGKSQADFTPRRMGKWQSRMLLEWCWKIWIVSIKVRFGGNMTLFLHLFCFITIHYRHGRITSHNIWYWWGLGRLTFLSGISVFLGIT